MMQLLLGFVAPVISGVVCWQLTLRTLPKAVADYTHKKENDMEIPVVPKNRNIRMFLVILVACAMVIIIGAQAWLDNREDKRKDREQAAHDRAVELCTKEWADAYRDTTNIRVDANTELRKAQGRWVDAVGGIFLVFTEALRAPQAEQDAPADPQLIVKLEAALTEFSLADENLEKEQSEVDETADDNPYPELDLGCAAGRTTS